MPRKELLVMGFRHARIVAKCLRSKKLAALAGKKLHTGSLPVKATHANSSSTSSQTLRQPVAQRGGLDNHAAPSFAARAVPPSASSSRLISVPELKSATAALASSSPSFAASPVWGSNIAVSAAAHAASAAPQAAEHAPPARRVSAALARNPLYRLATLGEAGSAPASKTAEQVPAGAGRLNAALASYAKLGVPPTAKPVGRKLGLAAAMLKYAKLR